MCRAFVATKPCCGHERYLNTATNQLRPTTKTYSSCDKKLHVSTRREHNNTRIKNADSRPSTFPAAVLRARPARRRAGSQASRDALGPSGSLHPAWTPGRTNHKKRKSKATTTVTLARPTSKGNHPYKHKNQTRKSAEYKKCPSRAGFTMVSTNRFYGKSGRWFSSRCGVWCGVVACGVVRRGSLTLAAMWCMSGRYIAATLWRL